MKRTYKILAFVFVLCTLTSAVAPAVATAEQASNVIVATFDGSLHLSSDSTTLTNENNIGPGDTLVEDLIFKNDSGRTVRFALQNVVADFTDNPSSATLPNSLDMWVHINGEAVLSGRYGEALGITPRWFTVAAGQQIPLRISSALALTADNRHQGLTYKVRFHFEGRAEENPAPQQPQPTDPQQPTHPRASSPLVKTGDTVIGFVVALSFCAAALFVVLLLQRRRFGQQDGG